MSISISGDLTAVMQQLNTQNSSAAQANKLTTGLTSLNENSTDEELMSACKSFEAYLTEKVMTSVKDALVPKDEDEENAYMEMFGDRLYQAYAEALADNGQLGIAQKLYEAMKREYKEV